MLAELVELLLDRLALGLGVLDRELRGLVAALEVEVGVAVVGEGRVGPAARVGLGEDLLGVRGALGVAQEHVRLDDLAGSADVGPLRIGFEIPGPGVDRGLELAARLLGQDRRTGGLVCSSCAWPER